VVDCRSVNLLLFFRFFFFSWRSHMRLPGATNQPPEKGASDNLASGTTTEAADDDDDEDEDEEDETEDGIVVVPTLQHVETRRAWRAFVQEHRRTILDQIGLGLANFAASPSYGRDRPPLTVMR
jgi:hypothetical protein